jgi:hypothetical protein
MQAEQELETLMQDGRHDFDFFIGSWKISHRRLRERLKGSTDWEIFTGYSDARKILGGLGNMDEGRFEGEFGTLHAITVRLFNPTSQEWFIYWAASNRPTGEFDVPMIGKFENGVGTFYAQETHAGKHVYSRFIWTVSSADRCHWEQALSEDGGTTWETNWTMDFDRIPDEQA